MLCVWGCERKADVSSPARYEKQSIAFLYPGNWTITEDVDQDTFRYLFIESPGDAIMIIHIYLKKHALTLRDFVDQFAGHSGQEIPLGKIDNNYISTVVKATSKGSKTGFRERFSLAVGGMQIPHIREYVQLKSKEKAFFLISQAPERDFEKVRPGFDFIFRSFTLE